MSAQALTSGISQFEKSKTIGRIPVGRWIVEHACIHDDRAGGDKTPCACIGSTRSHAAEVKDARSQRDEPRG